MSTTRNVRSFLVAFTALVASCHHPAHSSFEDTLRLLPADTGTVIFADLKKLRGSALWDALLQIRDTDRSRSRRHDELLAATGFDPFTDVDSMVIGLPVRSAERDAGFVVVVSTAQPIDEPRWTRFLSTQTETIAELHRGKTLHRVGGSSPLWACALDARTIAVAGPDAIRSVVDLYLHAAPAARHEAALVELGRRVDASAAAWMVNAVNISVQNQFQMNHSVATLDTASGVRARVELDLGSAEQAGELAAAVERYRLTPSVLSTVGLQPIFDGLVVRHHDRTVTLELSLDKQQFQHVVGRLRALATAQTRS